MVALYSRASVSLDDFGAGWFGSAVLESLSCRCPVITWVDPVFMIDRYQWHPLLLARSESEIAGQLDRMFLLTQDERTDLADRSRHWVQSHFTARSTASNYLDIFRGSGVLL